MVASLNPLSPMSPDNKVTRQRKHVHDELTVAQQSVEVVLPSRATSAAPHFLQLGARICQPPCVHLNCSMKQPQKCAILIQSHWAVVKSMFGESVPS